MRNKKKATKTSLSPKESKLRASIKKRISISMEVWEAGLVLSVLKFSSVTAGPNKQGKMLDDVAERILDQLSGEQIGNILSVSDASKKMLLSGSV